MPSISVLRLGLYPNPTTVECLNWLSPKAIS